MSILTGSRAHKAEINVAPMIDVLLVLLVIFMVVKAPSTTGLDTQAPQPPEAASRPVEPLTDIVLTIRGDSLEINRERVSARDLHERLSQIYRLRPESVIFIRAERDLPFGMVAQAIDTAKGAGVARVALMGVL